VRFPAARVAAAETSSLARPPACGRLFDKVDPPR
jgi:hypothetical protein